MFVGASPDARLVSPWLGGHTPSSTGILVRCGIFPLDVKFYFISNGTGYLLLFMLIWAHNNDSKFVINTASAASPWDHVSPSPVPIRASGSSNRSSNSRHGGKSHQLSFSRENSEAFEVLYLWLRIFFPLLFLF